MEKQWKQGQTLFSWAPKSLQIVTAVITLKDLILGRKAMTNLESVIKSRDITLLTNVHLVKAMVLPVVMNECESWTIRKAECWRIDAFEPEVLEKTLEGPLRRSNQSILKEISPDYSLEGLMLKLKLQYFGYLMWRTDSLEKEGRRRKGWHRMRWLDGITYPMDMSVSKHWSWWWTRKPGMLQSMWSQSQTWLSVWNDWL